VFKRKLIQVLWIAAGVATLVLLGAAMQKKNRNTCVDVKIEIVGSVEHMFVNENDILDIINSNGAIKGKEMQAVDLRKLEDLLERNAWVKNAEIFFNNKRELILTIEEREPIARIFTVQESSFYIDTAANLLPLSDKYSARVPVFTGFSADKKPFTYADSLLMNDIVKVAKFIQADSFWNAQIAQVNILPNATFELIPVIGNEVIAIGKADELDKKFNRLFSFYNYAWLQNGINKYQKLDVEYDNQVVAIKRGVNLTADTTKAVQLMNNTNVELIDTVKNKKSIEPKAVLKKNNKN